jgi:hypothetical protein
LFHDTLHQFPDIHLLPLHRGTAYARKAQERIDQLAHLSCRCANAADVVSRLLINVRRAAGGKHVAEAIHNVERGAQVMRRRVRESLKVAVGLLKFLHVPANLGFQPRVFKPQAANSQCAHET